MFHAKQPMRQLGNFKVAVSAVRSVYFDRKRERERGETKIRATFLMHEEKIDRITANKTGKNYHLKKKLFQVFNDQKDEIQIIAKCCDILHIVSYLINSSYT